MSIAGKRKEGSKQRAVNFDWDVVDRVFPAAKDSDLIEMRLRYDTDQGVAETQQWLKRQEKNWRLEGNCPNRQVLPLCRSGLSFRHGGGCGHTPATRLLGGVSRERHRNEGDPRRRREQPTRELGDDCASRR